MEIRPLSGSVLDGHQHRFKLVGLMGSLGLGGDEACCRLVYNVDPGAGRIETQTAAQPLFPKLGHALARYKEEASGLWAVLNEPKGQLFGEACNEFASVAEAIAAAIAATTATFFIRSPMLEDRFVIKRVTEKSVSFRAENHILDTTGPDASAFTQVVKGRRCVIGREDVKWKPFDQGPQTFDAPGDELIIGIDGMRVQDRRSVWAAASIRRNPTLHWRFVYRTAEIYLQEPLVPFLEEKATVDVGQRQEESLGSRLGAALRPILASAPLQVDRPGLAFPLQIRLGIEPRRLVERFTGSVLPEPTPKVQLVCQANADGEAIIASQLASLFLEQLAGESLGSPSDARLILSVLLLTEDRQPLLDISRIAIPIDNLRLQS